MRVPLDEWRRPTDAAFAFRLRPLGGADGLHPEIPDDVIQTPVHAIASLALDDGEAARFAAAVDRWEGPEDFDVDGKQAWIGRQDHFEERPWSDRLDLQALDALLGGTVWVMRREDGRVDYLLRDHHMIDVALYHYATTGALPTRLFHADRHSDWCRDGYLNAHRPPQAATWWTLFEGLKRPETEAPVLGEGDVIFTTAQPGPEVPTPGRDVGAATRVPWWVDRGALRWEDALAHPDFATCDWISLDLDYFQPASQLRLSKGLLRDPRFHAAMARARVRIFCLSPQFCAGGERLREWRLQGGRHASLRMLNLLRGAPPSARA